MTEARSRRGFLRSALGRADRLAMLNRSREPSKRSSEMREDHAVARRQQRRLTAARVPQRRWGAADETEPAGRLAWEEAGHLLGDSHRPCGDPRSGADSGGAGRVRLAGRRDRVARKEAQHVDAMDHPAVPGDQRIGQEAARGASSRSSANSGRSRPGDATAGLRLRGSAALRQGLRRGMQARDRRSERDRSRRAASETSAAFRRRRRFPPRRSCRRAPALLR